ncbi:unnamed protein product, partial [Pelagomonas calceolata]
RRRRRRHHPATGHAEGPRRRRRRRRKSAGRRRETHRRRRRRRRRHAPEGAGRRRRHAHGGELRRRRHGGRGGKGAGDGGRARAKHGVGLDGVVRVVRREQPLRLRAVALGLRVALEGVADLDLLVAEELAVHALDREVRGLEAVVAHEAVALRAARVGVAHDLGRLGDRAKGREGVVEQLLVHVAVEAADEEVRADLDGAPVLRRLVHAQRLAEELDHVHDLERVVRVLLAPELDEAVALVRARHLVARQVHVRDGARLQHHLPEQLLGELLVEVAHVARRVLVPLLDGARGHGGSGGACRRGLVLGGLGRAAWLSTGRDARLRSLQISLVHGFSAKEPRGARLLRRL